MKKFFKIFAGVLLSVLLLVIAGMVALIWLIDPNDYKPQLQQLAEKQHIELHIEGNLGWSFYPQFGIRAGKFSVKPAMKNASPPFQFYSVVVSVKWWPLLHRQIIVNNLTLRATEIIFHDAAGGNDTTIKNLLLEAHDMNLDQRAFALSVSLNASTTQPPRDINIKAATYLSLDRELQHVLLNNLSLQFDDTQFTGTIDATLGSAPYLKVNLAGTQLDVDHYFPTTNDGHQGHTLTRHSTQDKQDELVPASSIQALPGDFHFTFQNLILKHLRAEHFSTSMQISPRGLLTIKDLSTGIYGGEFTMHGTVDTQPAQPDVSLKMVLRRLSLGSAVKDYFQLEKTFATGDINFDATITSQGLTQAQLMQAMAGEFSFNSERIALNNFDITSSLDTTLLQLLQVKLPKLASNENETAMLDIKGKGTIEHGMLHNTGFSAYGPCMQFKGAGSYNLSNADVLYNMGITFPSTDPDQACSEINKKLKDVEWPVVCKGSLNDGAAKICGADNAGMQAIVKKIAKKDLSNKLEKKYGKDLDALKNKLKGMF